MRRLNISISMMLSRDAIEELKKIYQDECGTTLSDAEAQDMGQRLLALFQILARPLPAHAPETPHDDPPPIDGSFHPDTLREKA